MAAYYNEMDPKAAAWLRELIKCRLIAPGEVDERSILDVCPADLAGFVQCHFFAGIGVWSYALRCAGWTDDRPVWTGSCPCQPFSAAGKRAGVADERHLWPAFFHLIGERRPGVVFGEQVESKDGRAWLDAVQADMEGIDYAFGPFALPAAGFGSPHPRHRLFWVADSDYQRPQGWRGVQERTTERPAREGGVADELGKPDCARREPGRIASAPTGHRGTAVATDGVCGVAHADGRACGQGGEVDSGRRQGSHEESRTRPSGGQLSCVERPGPTNGLWRSADWIGCTDGKWRPVEPGTFPLAHGAPARVGRLRGYGNAIVAPVAQEFIEAYMNR